MINPNNIDGLSMALALNTRMQETFFINRLGAIEEYNKLFAPRYGQKQIVLNDEEKQLIVSLPCTTLDEVYELLAGALDQAPSRQSAHYDRNYSSPISSAA